MTHVQLEAQHQADIREAELRGITVEELIQRKELAKKIVDEQATMTTGQTEVSHSMRM